MIIFSVVNCTANQQHHGKAFSLTDFRYFIKSGMCSMRLHCSIHDGLQKSKRISNDVAPQISLFEKLNALTPKGQPFAWLMSHPKTEDRISAIRKLQSNWDA